MEGNHDILVAGASSDEEAASVISEELAKLFCYDKNLVGRCCNGRRQNRQRRQQSWLGFCRPDILMLLGKIAHDCLVSIRTVPGCIGVGEAIEGVAVAGFDGVEPSLLDRKAQAGMIEFNQGTNAGGIKAVWVE